MLFLTSRPLLLSPCRMSPIIALIHHFPLMDIVTCVCASHTRLHKHESANNGQEIKYLNMSLVLQLSQTSGWHFILEGTPSPSAHSGGAPPTCTVLPLHPILVVLLPLALCSPFSSSWWCSSHPHCASAHLLKSF